MLLWLVFAICVSSCYASQADCTASCGGGMSNATGTWVLCNTHPCPHECDKCAWTNGVGYLPDFDDCNCYYQCVPVKADHNGQYSWKVVRQCCPNCLDFDPETCVCNYPCMDKCCSGALYLFTAGGRYAYQRSAPPPALPADAVFATATTNGASWELVLDDGTVVVVDQNTCDRRLPNGLVVVNVTKIYLYEAGPWEAWDSWSDCYAWCDWQGIPHGGQEYRRRGRHVVNWFDRDCPCEEQNQSCNHTDPDPFVCPTHFTVDPCPVVFWMDFDDNLLDRFGSKVLQHHGVLGYSNESAPACLDHEQKSGEFDGDMLHVPFFSNWFSYPNNQAFTLSFWYNTATGSAGVLFSNGCDGTDGGAFPPTVEVSVSGDELHAKLLLDDGATCDCSLAYTGGGWQFAALFFDGGELTLHGGAMGCETEKIEPCQGHIGNNKCALFIGSSNTMPANYYEGLLDEVKVYTMEKDQPRPSCCPCPP